jgi:hypothetical protein
MYTVYYIPDFVWLDGTIGKIGCTEQEPQQRVKDQGYINYEVLEEHVDVYIASDRELALQKQYGLPVDKMPYWKVIKMPTAHSRKKGGQIGGKIGGQKAKELGVGAMCFESRSKAGKVQGKKNVESGHLKTISSISGKIHGKINANKERVCPYCLIKSNGIGFYRWHGENCKAKPK